MPTIADLSVKYSADTKALQAGSQKAEGLVTGLGSKLGGVMSVAGGMVLGGAVQAVVGGVGQLAGAALDFESGMANVNSIAQLSAGELSRLSDQVFQLSGDPRITAGPAQLAAGLYDIYSSGFQGQEGLAVLEAASLAATAGLTTTDVASRAITASLNAYGLGADQAGRVSDVLFKTVDQGVISFETLANNLGNTLPVANSLGISIEELGASYALMTLKGVSGAQAETQIAGLMRSALNPTTELTAAVGAHGYASAEAAIASEGMAGFLKMVMQASGGSKEALFDMLGTQEAVNAALILGAENGEDYNAMLAEMEGAAGSTERALEKQMQSAKFNIAIARKEVERLATLFMGMLAPGITFVATNLAKLISGFISFISTLKYVLGDAIIFEQWLNTLPGFIQPVFQALFDIQEPIRDLIDAFQDLMAGDIEGFLKELNEVFPGLGDAVGAVLPYLFQFSDWITGVALPALGDFAGWITGTAIPAVVDFGSAVVTWIGDEVIPTLTSIWDTVGPALGDFSAWFIDTAIPAIAKFFLTVNTFITNGVVPAISDFWSQVKPALDEFKNWFIDTAIPAIAKFFLAANNFITNGVVPALVTIWDTVGPALLQFSGWFIDTVIPAVAKFYLAYFNFIINGVIPAIVTIWETVSPYLLQLSGWFIDTAIPAIAKFFLAANNFITNGVIPALQDVWETVGPALEDFSGWFIDTAIPAIAKFFLAVNNFITNGVIPALVTIWETIGPPLTSFAGWFIDTAIPAIAKFFLAVNNFITNGVIPTLVTIWETIGPPLESFSGWFIDTAIPAIAKFFLGVNSFITNGVIPALVLVWDTVKPGLLLLSGWLQDAAGYADDLWTAIEDMVDQGSEKLSGWWDGISSKVQPLLDFLDKVIELAKSAVEWLNKIPGVGGSPDVAAAQATGASARGGIGDWPGGTSTAGGRSSTTGTTSGGVMVSQLPNVGAGPGAMPVPDYSAIINAANTAKQKVVAAFTNMRLDVAALLVNFVADAAAKGLEAGAKLSTNLTQGLNAAKANVLIQTAAMTTLLTTFATSAAAKGLEAGAKFSTNLNQGLGAAKANVLIQTAAMTTQLETFASNASAKGLSAGQKFNTGVNQGMGAALANVKIQVANILAAMSFDGFSRGYTGGSSFGSGVAAGANAMGWAAYVAGQNLATQLNAGYNSIARPGSPSKLGIQAGSIYGEGVVVGVESWLKAATNIGADLAGAVARPIYGTQTAGARAGATPYFASSQGRATNITIWALKADDFQKYLAMSQQGHQAYVQTSSRSRELAFGLRGV